MEIVHRTNTLDCFYRHYYKNDCRFFEIDVQPSNDTILVYHDDLNKISNSTSVIMTLEEFLRLTPNAITINIEIKKYNSKNINLELIQLLKQYPFKKYILSSFDKEVCKELLPFHYPVFHLLSTIEEYDKTFVNICIHKKLLDILNFDDYHEKVYVYQVKKKDLRTLKKEYPHIKGWIYD